jgi:hypothetical protein
MACKRKIAECINVRINVGNYQHIELTKYGEEEIEFNSPEERIEKEDSLRNDLLTSLIRSMKVIPERLDKGIEQAIEVGNAIKKAIPEWLAKGPIPNIANGAKASDIQATARQDDQKKSVEQIKDIDIIGEDTPVKKETLSKKEELTKNDINDDLFDDDFDKKDTTTKNKEKDIEDSFGTNEASDDSDVFGDEDVF